MANHISTIEPELRPKLIAFDLDGTIWSPDMYELWGGGGAPFKRVGEGTATCKDRKGETVRLLGVAGQILPHAEKEDILLAYVSTCDEPAWAHELLGLFRGSHDREGADAHKLLGEYVPADLVHIYKASSKQTHFQRIRKARPDIAFEDMVFFDNQHNNIAAVRRLGVHCVFCPDGMTEEVWVEGLNSFAALAKGRL